MELTPELWRRVKGIASGALDRADADQAAYVVDACGGDEALRREVESLLRSTVAAGTAAYLELPAVAVAPMSMGTRIGAYRLVRELGSGGMGAVYLAERDDREFQQRVAIKVVRGGLASAFLLHRFREERRILASLEHPNIARLLDGGASDGGLPYVVMEYVDGESIDVYCRTRRLPLA
ncbi:MAG: serine/threonine protein kinase, partial [Acidobacteria bacterium]